MAVETKIGLVVGLGFIVCFGVILQHRGSGDRLSTDVALELLNRHREPVAESQPPRTENVTRSTPGDGRTISALPNRNAPVQTPRNKVRNSRPPAARRGSGAIRPGTRSANAQATRPNAVQNKPGATTKPRPRQQAKAQPIVSPPKSPAYEALFGADATARETKPPKEEHKPQIQKSTKPPVRRAPARRAKPAAKEDRTYVVKPGDSLWGIAEREYGRQSRELVDALYAANRGQMSSPGALKVGMRLSLPPAGKANANAKTDRELAVHRASAATPVRFYQVQKGDRYTTIAERFLGEKARWKELYELNKDIFPDAGRIRPGVRIRLPATVLADAR